MRRKTTPPPDNVGALPERVDGNAPPSIRSLADATALLSDLITEFRGGGISERNAKTLCYLVISYISAYKDSAIESRLQVLERKYADNGN